MARITRPATATRVVAVICDRCSCRTEVDSPTFNSITRIQHQCGYGSAWEDGALIEVDLCESCLKALIGDYCKVVDEPPSYRLRASVDNCVAPSEPIGAEGWDAFFTSGNHTSDDFITERDQCVLILNNDSQQGFKTTSKRTLVDIRCEEDYQAILKVLEHTLELANDTMDNPLNPLINMLCQTIETYEMQDPDLKSFVEEAEKIIPGEIWKETTDYFGSKRKAIQWLQTPSIYLGNETPANYCRRSNDDRKVLDLINRLKHGFTT